MIDMPYAITNIYLKIIRFCFAIIHPAFLYKGFLYLVHPYKFPLHFIILSWPLNQGQYHGLCQ